MNGVTKCDLSYNCAQLDYQAMLLTAKIAVGRSIDRIEDYKRQLHNAMYSDVTLIHLSGQRLAAEASYLAQTTDVLATLLGCQDREDIEIVNR